MHSTWRQGNTFGFTLSCCINLLHASYIMHFMHLFVSISMPGPRPGGGGLREEKSDAVAGRIQERHGINAIQCIV
jgi:hypothetical protein